MKITLRKLVKRPGIDSSWLNPWIGWTFKIKEYSSGKKIACLLGDKDGVHLDSGDLKYFSKPIKNH